MNFITDNLLAVRERIGKACATSHRAPESVQLLAVSKKFNAATVQLAIAAGLTDFGENYLQEGLDKIAALPREKLSWHFIGPVQSNKTRGLAEQFDWVHSVDRLKIAQRLSEQRPASLPPLNVCVQVNISGEASKSGCAPVEALALCQAVAALPRLKLRGLMAIPAPVADGADPRAPFRALRELFEQTRASSEVGAGFDTLSAGMSDDLEAAIAEGATMVRIGTAIFGSRSSKGL
ncbi:YggS family pyridoxal phosphate-dependent enzyme [Stenotrophobium rhamnosiphilum]|uniref:Pyridoxal phosphate homeostasis protein n=1 Tax=Stenotrophobium rhamnosiphilum TaxID=2029166 RepID=A0A2T5MDG1_9GAMM|nr:YggS family pyridoxal phosphate-dependent enzyme [Stenotrophobium rhamnosiphilum]PTU30618.1 YggS family pyridoxal phosphate-dependent enzyme [Stenotrophobium rhamnosiphilum]